ncbi:MAG TPA: VOC family protein [Ktedonobacteraceae bacterium]|jgi:catechol 2,3-dioxygenase-like lactoylglutathione lyase family enzyme|nr:VOC family protein [Ktedonobacteraceae bacterium]
MPIHLQTPERFVIYVSNMERSTAFYRDTLGLPLKFTSPGWTEFSNGGTVMALHKHMGGEAGAAQPAAGQATLVFVVDDLQSAYETLKAEGVHFSLEPQKQPSGLTFGVLSDPDGFGITLQQRQA